MKSTIYLIYGLGANRRAFRKLKFSEDLNCIYLDWILPLPNETLASYALRLSKSIDTSKPFYLIGLSFGGMLTTEIAKQLNPLHAFLISSAAVFNELPWYFKTAGKLRLERIVPFNLMKTCNSIGLKFLGAKTQDEKLLLKQLIVDSDPRFIKWALTCILNWRNTIRPSNLTCIHGNADRLLPIRYINPDFVIDGGSHFMVYARADEIMKIIMDEINRH
ncbi:alpha/beta fold hydrolase [Pedobacter sp. JCM 36344]|uniref:alpha/beta fold hydrolase n=1 Tax=Pedobacter sp. JCM 36344 TaxID=3374280 RepID=UPI00397A0B94